MNRWFPRTISIGAAINGGAYWIETDEEIEAVEITAYRYELLNLEPSLRLSALEGGYRVEPKFYPDYEFWFALPSWTSEQAVALVFAKNPVRGDSNCLERLWSQPDPPASEGIAYLKVLSRIQRAQLVGKLADPIMPQDFVSWADQEKLQLPTELRKAFELAGVQRIGDQLPGSEHRRRNKKSSPKDSNALDRPIAGKELLTHATIMRTMAARYGFNPNGNDTAASTISEEAWELGHPISDDTVRTHLIWMYRVAEEDKKS